MPGLFFVPYLRNLVQVTSLTSDREGNKKGKGMGYSVVVVHYP